MEGAPGFAKRDSHAVRNRIRGTCIMEGIFRVDRVDHGRTIDH